jgi:cis-3-alkyl-4-acyloxetan-2-one decarboxylase
MVVAAGDFSLSSIFIEGKKVDTAFPESLRWVPLLIRWEEERKNCLALLRRSLAGCVVFDYPFTSRYYSAHGHRLHYLDEGRGPVVVMVHGNPTWSYYYRHAITQLADNHRVIAVDHMGCGLSDKPQDYPYCLQQHITNLCELLDHVGIDKYSLMIHDWGGAIGMGCAVMAPERIEKIVIFNTAAFRSTRIPFRIRICRWPLIGRLIVQGLNGFAWPAQFMAVTKPLAKEVAAAYLKPYDCWVNRVAIYRFVRDIPLKADHESYAVLENIEHSLHKLQTAAIPKMIIWGGKDFCFDQVFYDEWCRRFPEAGRHYFADAGHYILEDKRDEIAVLLEDFFSAKG